MNICLLPFFFFCRTTKSHCETSTLDYIPAVPASATVDVPPKPESDEKSPTEFENSKSEERREASVEEEFWDELNPRVLEGLPRIREFSVRPLPDIAARWEQKRESESREAKVLVDEE